MQNTPKPRPSISVSHMRSLKSSRAHASAAEMGISPDALPQDWDPSTVFALPPGPHAPAKKEAKALRRICAQTGLTPEQVRERKAYRVELAKAAKEQGTRTPWQRKARRLRKRLQAQLGLAPWSPELKTAFVAEWSRQQVWATRASKLMPPAEQAFEESL